MVGLFALTAFGALGCLTSPTDGTALSTPDASKTFQGYSLTAGAAVAVQAFNYKTQQWDTIGTGTASNTVSIAANTAGNNPELYAFSVAARVANASDPRTTCHWRNFDQQCDSVPLANVGVCDFAKVRVQVGGFNALTFTDTGDDCVQQELAQGENAVNAAINCQSPNSPQVTLTPRPGTCIF